MFVKNCAGTLLAVLGALVLVQLAPVRAEGRDADWDNSMYVESTYMEVWAFTWNNESQDSYVDAWINGYGVPNSADGPGYQETTASVRDWNAHWCGFFSGGSAHYLTNEMLDDDKEASAEGPECSR